MSTVDDENQGGDSMTLAFSLAAIEAVERPRRVFDDAREWSRSVGIVSRDAHNEERFARDHGLEQDFFTGDRGLHESLAIVEHQVDSERYVFVGASDDDRRVADAAGWEYLPIEEAAAKADWDLASPDGVFERLVRYIEDLL